MKPTIDLVNQVDHRLDEIGVPKRYRAQWIFDLIESGVLCLRQRKPGTKRKYRSVMLYPDEGWTLDSVRRLLDKPW